MIHVDLYGATLPFCAEHQPPPGDVSGPPGVIAGPEHRPALVVDEKAEPVMADSSLGASRGCPICDAAKR